MQVCCATWHSRIPQQRARVYSFRQTERKAQQLVNFIMIIGKHKLLPSSLDLVDPIRGHLPRPTLPCPHPHQLSLNLCKCLFSAKRCRNGVGVGVGRDHQGIIRNTTAILCSKRIVWISCPANFCLFAHLGGLAGINVTGSQRWKKMYQLAIRQRHRLNAGLSA